MARRPATAACERGRTHPARARRRGGGPRPVGARVDGVLHNGAVAAEHPDCAPENAFGDRYVTDLCPANPDVRAFAVALAAEVAHLGVTSINAESLHFHALEHGYAHERYFVPLGPVERYLLGLCFCRHCLGAAHRHGVDGQAVRRFARAEPRARLRGRRRRATDRADRTLLGTGAGGELAGYLEAREETVTTLVAEVAGAARAEGTRFEFIDLAGAVKGYATGRPEGAEAPSISWQPGVEVAAVAAACDGISAIGYAAEPGRVRDDLEAYGDAAVSVIFRPMPPDCDSVENLQAKVEVARERGLRRVDFYHYGFMRLSALDLIRAALT